MRLPYDHVFDRGWEFGIKVRLLTPPPCGHGIGDGSTIAAPGTPRVKLHWSRRGYTCAHRLSNEWRRLIYGVRHVWLERFKSG